MEVRGAEKKQKEAADGEETFPYINVQAMPLGRGKDNEPLNPPDGVRWGTVWDRVSLSPAAEWRLTNFCLAMGLTVNAKGEIVGNLELDEGKPGSIIGKKALLRVKAGKRQDGETYRAEAGNWSPLDGVDNDIPEDESFADEEPEGDEGTFGDEPEESADDEYLTEDYLRSLEPKDLAALLGEFDLEKEAFYVKTRGKVDVKKTTDAMIEGILEAQGADDTDEEDPF